MNDISFTGGFLIKNTTPKKWNNLLKSIPGSKNVFEKINDEGDKFLVTQNYYDKFTASQILKRKINCVFYPNINTKHRLDSYHPEEAVKLIKVQKQKIDTPEDMRDFIHQGSRDIKPLIFATYKWKPEDHIEKTFKALELDPKDCKTQIINGITIIKNKQGKIIAKASPNNEKGINFVYAYPKNIDDSSKKFALTQGGEKHEFGPLQIKDFQERFMRNVKIDLGRKRPEK